MKINVVDSICGSGKTTAAINMINSSDDNTRYIYVTPFLTEVDRIKEQCKSKDFCSPEAKIKLNNLKELLKNGRNIVTTHALFQSFDKEIIDLCKDNEYVLIMDEVTDVIDTYIMHEDDVAALYNTYIDILEDGRLSWKEQYKDYSGRLFKTVKYLVDTGNVYYYSDTTLIWTFPVEIFTAFKESYILTYMFNGQLQKYYYDLYDLKYQHLYVTKDYKFTNNPIRQNHKYNYSELINILDDKKLNAIGKDKFALSHTWYTQNKNAAVMKQFKNHVLNFFVGKATLWTGQNYIKSSGLDNLWTTFKEYKNLLKGKGYTKGFAPVTARATNDWRNRTVIAYLVNRYINPNIKNFFITHDIKVDEDAFALSEMIQFIWRSGIRDGKHITVYIPSKRMRNLLKQWIAENSLTK